MALLSGLRDKLKAVVQDPKNQKRALVLGSYAAGAYGGPAAKVAVEKYGPEYGPYLLKGIVLLLGG